MRAPRASSVIVQRVPPHLGGQFLEWQRGIGRAMEQFPGYQATELYPPTDNRRPEWVIVLHFNDARTLQDWLNSPVRAEWIAKLPQEIRDYDLMTLASGFGPWFAGMQAKEFPPHWKMALAVLFGLYPVVMLLAVFLGPYTNQWFGMAFAMLIGNAGSVCVLEWVVMPAITRLLRPWFRAGGEKGNTISIVGGLLILAALVVLAVVFRQATT